MIILQFLTGTTLSAFLKERIAAMKNRSVLYHGHPYSKEAIASWEKFLSLWQEFCCEMPREKRIKNLTAADFDALMNYCDERSFRESTRMLVASLFKAALRAAQVEGITGLMPWLKECSAPPRAQTEAKKVWLNPDEIRALEELKLKPESPLRKARDIFLVGCYTGQRFSDYRRLTLSDIVTFQFDGKEHHAFRKKQQKTGKEIYIPILDDKVLRILEQWGGGLPPLSNSLLNREIKVLCKMAGIEETVKVVERLGSRELVRLVPKYELVASHTARRSFITERYLEGRLTEMQIRSISGHQSSHAFKKYICCSPRDNLKGIFNALSDKT